MAADNLAPQLDPAGRSAHLDGLNLAQRAAVTHRGGPLLVSAGPGSGKTRVLTRRIAYRLTCESVPPDAIVAVTFTVRAANEMKRRVASLADGVVPPRMGTFHALCHALLRRQGHRGRVGRHFRLLTSYESRRILNDSLGSSSADQRRRLAAAISAIKNGLEFEAVAKGAGLTPEALRAAYAGYQGRLGELHALDLDDLQHEAVALLRADDRLRAACRRSVEEMLIDEYQDTNPIQQELIQLMLPESGNLVAVGDEDQAIYGWRHAARSDAEQFLACYPNAAIVKLEDTYRSTKHILRAATSVVAHNPDRLQKSLRTENPAGERPLVYASADESDEARWIALECKRLHEDEGVPWTGIAILYRVNAQSRALEDGLMRDRIPYRVINGDRFYDRPEVRLVIALLRMVADPSDDGAASFVLSHVRGIGKKRLDELRLRAAAAGHSLWNEAGDEVQSTKFPRDVRYGLASVRQEIDSVLALREHSVDRVIDAAILAVSGEWNGVRDDVDADVLGEFKSALARLAGTRGTVPGLLSRFVLGDESQPNADGVSLLSLHSAKGSEYDAVFIAGVEEGLLPHRRSVESDAEVEEERRLCYVGMTRAKRWLYMSYAHSRSLGGHMLGGGRSRFIGEIGPPNITLRASPDLAAGPRLLHIEIGDRVAHPRWRQGTVVAVHGEGRQTLVTIAFDEGNRERVQLCHAPLRRAP